MKINFGLGWAERNAKNRLKLFKDSSAAALFEKYRERIQHEFNCAAVPLSWADLKNQTGAVWICERSKKSRAISSADLAGQLKRVCDSGVKNLTIWIGGPDGIPADVFAEVKVDLIWSFGPLTLPHELAAVVASEQIYRAISILKNHPYHTGH